MTLSTTEEKEEFSNEELEQIMGMHGPEEPISIKEIRQTIREYPLLAAGLAFVLGLLVGVSLRPRRNRSG